MSLTPADVHNVAFSKPPIGKRGYNEDEVDAFLDLVETELARLIEDNNELRQQVEQLDAELESSRSETESAKANKGETQAQTQAQTQASGPQSTGQDGPSSRRLAPVPPPGSAMEQTMEQTQNHGIMGDNSEPNVQAAKVLGLAQEMADRLTAEAKTESDAMLSEARTKSEQLLSDARSKADSMVNEGRTRAETMLNDARTRAETLERQARDKATNMDREAQRKYSETMNTLNSEKSALNKKIEELRTIEREYRTRLRGFLESQLRELDDRGSAAPASAATANSSTGEGGSENGSGDASGNSAQNYSLGTHAEAG